MATSEAVQAATCQTHTAAQQVLDRMEAGLQGNSDGTSCEIVAFVTREQAVFFGSILEYCFPKADYAALRAAESRVPRSSPASPPAVLHCFKVEGRRVPIAELKTLSQTMPEVRFVLRYRAAGNEHGSKDQSASETEDATFDREVEVIAGEVVKFQGADGERAEIDAFGYLGSWWLHVKAEKLLESVFNNARQESAGGICSDWKHSMSIGLIHEAYVHVRSRLDAMEQKMLDILKDGYEQILELIHHRSDAADAQEAVAKVLDWASGDEPSAAVVEPLDLEQLRIANGILAKIAGDVPARSKWI